MSSEPSTFTPDEQERRDEILRRLLHTPPQLRPKRDRTKKERKPAKADSRPHVTKERE